MAAKGTNSTLLSIQQTLRYRGMGFLDFLRSGRLEIRRSDGDRLGVGFWLPAAISTVKFVVPRTSNSRQTPLEGACWSM